MKHLLFLGLCSLSLLSCAQETPVKSISSTISSSQEVEEVDEAEDFCPNGYSLKWSEEFDGERLNTNVWTYETGNNHGWGNAELEYYTDHNETVSDGLLSIHAKKEDVQDGDTTYHYTSSRLVSRGKAHFTYGYMCARIRLPLGTGLWPAFWMMPETGYGTSGHTWWPTPGEIDIMEAKGRVRDNAAGALHYSSNGTGGNHVFQAKDNFGFGNIDDFHVYAVDWNEEKITWIYDGKPFFTVGKATWNAGYGGKGNDPFNKDFYFILNLAIGGNYDGGKAPEESFTSASMDVDFVRCYQK